MANAIMDEAVNEVTLEYLANEQEDAAAERAAACIDNPTLENIMQALERMEVCQCGNSLTPLHSSGLGVGVGLLTLLLWCVCV